MLFGIALKTAQIWEYLCFVDVSRQFATSNNLPDEKKTGSIYKALHSQGWLKL
jgi:hypothetical protein